MVIFFNFPCPLPYFDEFRKKPMIKYDTRGKQITKKYKTEVAAV